MSSHLWRIEDGKLKLSLHSGQAKAWKSEKRFVFVIAGTQGGKTSFCRAVVAMARGTAVGSGGLPSRNGQLRPFQIEDATRTTDGI